MHWSDRYAALTRTASRKIFFIGGAPRSGTTWLQQMLDAHPRVSCRGESLVDRTFVAPIDRLFEERRATLAGKNEQLFRHTGGYPLPDDEDRDALLATAILLALDRQRGGAEVSAIGEKSPENVFLFPRLKRLFPDALFLGIARDPRDVIASSWHLFRGNVGDEAAKLAFVREALPSICAGMRAMLAMAQADPASCRVVTYEALHADPAQVLPALFRWIGVDAGDGIVQACVERTRFGVLTGAQPDGREIDRNFLRKGVVGDWTTTLSPAIASVIMEEAGWSFSAFGWRP